MRKNILFIALLVYTAAAYSQTKQTELFNRTWGGYFNQTRLSDKWGLWADIHLRTKDWVDGLAQNLLRVGATYYVTDHVKLTAGYAYITDFPAPGHKNISVYEHRPWQQLQWHTRYGRQKMMQWFRLEERYRRKILNDDALADGYNFNWRLRYNIWYEMPFYKNGTDPKSWSFIINDEVHVNFGKQIVNNYFDQNRFFLGFKYQTGRQSNLQFGYMNWFQQLAAGNRYRNSHVARVFFFQNLDLRRKK
jgi:Protein of unknown function (DUF2490)